MTLSITVFKQKQWNLDLTNLHLSPQQPIIFFSPAKSTVTLGKMYGTEPQYIIMNTSL